MSNKLRDIFCPDRAVVERAIKRIMNQAYDAQECMTCKNVYYDDEEKLLKNCSISEGLCKGRDFHGCNQLCLFYEPKNDRKDKKWQR